VLLTAILAAVAATTAPLPSEAGPAAVAVRIASPVPRHEARTVAPSPRHVWVTGHWSWTGHTHVWVDGAWRLPPSAHASWVAGRWSRRAGGWVWVPGHWRGA